MYSMRIGDVTVGRWGRLTVVLLAVALGLGSVGCEVHSWMGDPRGMGGFERTPREVPILRQLDLIDEPSPFPEGLSEVRPEDLVPVVEEYRMGPGDLVTFQIMHLVVQGQESVITREVDELGRVRLPRVGTVELDGVSASEAERMVGRRLEELGLVRDPMVSVLIQQRRQATFSINGEPRQGGIRVGTYQIIGIDFRILDALTLAGGVPGATKSVYIIRRIPLEEPDRPVDPDAPVPPDRPLPRDPEELLEELQGALGDPMRTEDAGVRPPRELVEDDLPEPPMVHLEGRWVRADEAERPRRRVRDEDDALRQVVTQRIIMIPYDRLRVGDMRYNVVIRPGDIIWVPPPTLGNVFIEGEVVRPGTFALPGDGDLTLKRLVAAAGGLTQTAVPQRVELTRRIGPEREVIMRLDYQAIREGREPDIFLKENDLVRVGTAFWATPLAVIRNGFRTSYGFGFVLDRNFNVDVFGR